MEVVYMSHMNGDVGGEKKSLTELLFFLLLGIIFIAGLFAIALKIPPSQRRESEEPKIIEEKKKEIIPRKNKGIIMVANKTICF